MRNLKRALSLALASVMLLGMMVVGSSAAFADADEIVNTEAVEITAGLGLFAGADGKFNPTGTVTRAQMATVIAKMLYGSEINADQFKGSGKFSDTVAFEGGWAEGYINLCANLGIVGGYGDGTFKPGQAVTTAEAVTMIINALGVDAGKGTWPLTVMAKAEEMELFAELTVKPGTNVALTRDQLASIVLEGIKYSPSGVTGYTVDGVENIKFTDIADALTAAKNDTAKIKEIIGEDALYSSVFEVQEVTGFVTSNQATSADQEYTEITVYTYNEDKKKLEETEYYINLETGLDMIGHYVTAYYAKQWKSVNEPGAAYCIYDEAEYVTVNKPEVDTQKEYKEFFEKATKLTAKEGATTDGKYKVSGANGLAIEGYVPGEDNVWSAPEGTYGIYEGKIVTFIAPSSSWATKVTKVTTNAGKESITILGQKPMDNTADNDVVNEYDGIAKNDIVLVTVAQDNVYTLTKADVVSGKVTKTGTDEYKKPTITIDGKVYTQYSKDITNTGLENDTTKVDFNKNYDVYVSGDKFIGFKTAATEADISDVIYVLGAYDVPTKSAYGDPIINYYMQGVDMEGKEVSYLIGIDYDAKVNANGVKDLGICTEKDKEAVEPGYYTFELHTDKDEKKAGIMVAEALAKEFLEDEPTIYVDTIPDTTELKSDTSSVRTVTNEDLAFITDTTKFIVVEGKKGEVLEIAVLTGSIRKDLSAAAPVVLSQDDKGTVTMEVVVIEVETLGMLAEDYIFVSDAQAATSATVGDDLYEYEVYFTKTGETQTVILAENAKDIPTGNGFYTYTYDAVEGTYDLTEVTEEEYKDGYLLKNEIFDTAKGTYVVSDNIEGLNAAEAKIVDVRSAKTLDESDIPAIETLEEMIDATTAEYAVTFWAILDEDKENVTNIFIVSVEEK